MSIDVPTQLRAIARQVQRAGWTTSPAPPGACWVATHAAGSTVIRCERWEAIVRRWPKLPAQPPQDLHLVVAWRTDAGEVHVALFEHEGRPSCCVRSWFDASKKD